MIKNENGKVEINNETLIDTLVELSDILQEIRKEITGTDQKVLFGMLLPNLAEAKFRADKKQEVQNMWDRGNKFLEKAKELKEFW